jgi:modification methylase
MELNKIYCIDVLEGLRKLEDDSIDLIITSPPYNLSGFRGYKPVTERGARWHRKIVYGENENIDFMPEDEYREWQIEILNECWRVLKPTGSMFYNHKHRIKNFEISSPLEWIYKSKFYVRQEIIWDRGSTVNLAPVRFLPTTERIYWLTKGKSEVRFSRKYAVESFNKEVWRFDFNKNTKHPAPYPIELPNIIIPTIAQGERIVVLDPFMGSGTTALSAKLNGCDYIGFELFQEYVDMANERLKE